MPARVVRRELAEQDIDAAVDHYLDEGGADLALRFAAALESTLEHIAGFPGTGSPRFAGVARIRGLRFWPVSRFPYLVFYVEAGAGVEILRVLHEQRDLPRVLAQI